jgi:hypothetical protein
MTTLPPTSLVLAIAFVFTVGQAPAQTFAPPSPASDNPTREVFWTAGEVTRTLFTKKSRDLWQYVRGGVAFTLKMKALDSGHSYQITRGKGYGGTVTFSAGFTDLPVSGVAAYTWSFTAHSPSRRYEQGQPLAVVVVTDQTTRQSQVITFEIEGTPSPTGDDFQRTNNIPNAIVQLDLCPDARAPMRILSSATGRVRTWPFVRHRELVSFEVKNVNTLRHTVTITSELRDIVPAAGRNVLSDLIDNSASRGQPAPDKQVKGTTGNESTEEADARHRGNADKLLQKIDGVGSYPDILTELKTRLTGIECLTETIVHELETVFLERIDYRVELRAGANALRRAVEEDLKLAKEEIEKINTPSEQTAARQRYEATKIRFETLKIEETVSRFRELSSPSVLIGTARSMPKLIYGKNADAVRFTVSRATIGATGAAQTETYDLPIVGGLKFDLSAGFFFSRLVDERYTFTDSTGGEKKYLNQQDVGRFSVGIGTLLHVYTRPNWLHGFVNPGLCLGASLHGTGNGARTRYHAGVSLLLGRGQRVVASFGVTAGQVARLAAPFKAGRAYDFGQTPQVPLEDRFESHWFKPLGFFSLTYNLNLNANGKVD